MCIILSIFYDAWKACFLYCFLMSSSEKNNTVKSNKNDHKWTTEPQTEYFLVFWVYVCARAHVCLYKYGHCEVILYGLKELSTKM